MNPTCFPDNCAWHKIIGGTKEECPHYMQTTWMNEKGEIAVVDDCTPRRTLILIQELVQSNIGVQQSNEQLRNENKLLTDNFKKVILTLKHAANKELDNGTSKKNTL